MDSENQNEVERKAEKPEASQQAQPEPQKDKAERGSANVASQQAPKISIPKLNLPRIQIQSDVLQNIANKLKEYKRVLLITKKPDMDEFKTTVKASALGIAIIGTVGFIIAIIAQLLTT